jgi:hypothetical protein
MPRVSKFNARKTVVDGITFPSKLEASIYCLFKAKERNGQIKNLRRQVRIHLVAGIYYVVDFSYETPTGMTRYVEAKGIATPAWKIKKKLWREFGPGALEIWKGTYVRPLFEEEVEGADSL